MREKTISRSNSRNNSRIKLMSLSESEQEAEEEVDYRHIHQPNEINVVQLNPPKERERQPRE
jgi:hypothetical protein